MSYFGRCQTHISTPIKLRNAPPAKNKNLAKFYQVHFGSRTRCTNPFLTTHKHQPLPISLSSFSSRGIFRQGGRRIFCHDFCIVYDTIREQLHNQCNLWEHELISGGE